MAEFDGYCMGTTQGIGTAHVLDEGRVTIPAPVRRQLNLKRGDLVRLRVEPVERDNE